MGKRYHFYQGYSPAQTAIPIALMKAFGVEMVILSNAAGGLNSSFHVGDLMMIKDHISFLGMSGNNPLVGSMVVCDVDRSEQRLHGDTLPLPLQCVRRRAAEPLPRHGGGPGTSETPPGRRVRVPVGTVLRDAGRVQLPPNDRMRCCRNEHGQRGRRLSPSWDEGVCHFADYEYRCCDCSKSPSECHAWNHRLCRSFPPGS